jgi:hypothetical protein
MRRHRHPVAPSPTGDNDAATEDNPSGLNAQYLDDGRKHWGLRLQSACARALVPLYAMGGRDDEAVDDSGGGDDSSDLDEDGMGGLDEDWEEWEQDDGTGKAEAAPDAPAAGIGSPMLGSPPWVLPAGLLDDLLGGTLVAPHPPLLSPPSPREGDGRRMRPPRLRLWRGIGRWQRSRHPPRRAAGGALVGLLPTGHGYRVEAGAWDAASPEVWGGAAWRDLIQARCPGRPWRGIYRAAYRAAGPWWRLRHLAQCSLTACWARRVTGRSIDQRQPLREGRPDRWEMPARAGGLGD